MLGSEVITGQTPAQGLRFVCEVCDFDYMWVGFVNSKCSRFLFVLCVFLGVGGGRGGKVFFSGEERKTVQ